MKMPYVFMLFLSPFLSISFSFRQPMPLPWGPAKHWVKWLPKVRATRWEGNSKLAMYRNIVSSTLG